MFVCRLATTFIASSASFTLFTRYIRSSSLLLPSRGYRSLQSPMALSITSTRAELTGDPSLSFATWKGPLTDWSPPSSCKRLTEVIETNYELWRGTVSSSVHSHFGLEPTWARSWEGEVRSCFPPIIGDPEHYYYPGYCPGDWKAYTTSTIITAAAPPVAKSSHTTVMTFTDAACCPLEYSLEYNLEQFNSLQCMQFYNATSTRYDVVTWHLHIWTTDVGVSKSTWRSSYAISQEYRVPISRDTVVTMDPIRVRFPQYSATHTPSETAPYGPFNTSYVGYWRDYYGLNDDDFPAISPKVRTLLLGLCIPLGILFFSVIAYIFWYVRHRRKKSKSSKEEQAGSPGSAMIETAGVAETENKRAREPTHREVFVAERSGSLPAGSAENYVAPETEEERTLRYQEEALRERREQLAMEEEALRRKRAERRSAT